MIYFVDNGDNLAYYDGGALKGPPIPKHEIKTVAKLPSGTGIRIYMETGAQKSVADVAFPFSAVDLDLLDSENVGDYPEVTDIDEMVAWLKIVIWGSPGGAVGVGDTAGGVIDFTVNVGTEQLDLETTEETFSVPVKRIAQTQVAFTAVEQVIIPHSLGRLITTETYESISGGNYRRFSHTLVDDGSTAIVSWAGAKTGRVIWG
jgi:hypothetical protein